MFNYIIRRLVLMVPTLLGITAVVFFIMAMAPGGFTGVGMNAQGGLTQGAEARRIREYNNRRYGLDKPAIIQYGRWLNQVSPIGFKTALQIQFTDEEKELARQVLEADPFIHETNRINQALSSTVLLGAYEDIEPQVAARRVLDLIHDIDAGLAALEQINPQTDEFRDVLTKTREQNERSAKIMILDRLNTELAGRDRVLFSRPTIKWPDMGKSSRGRPVMEMLYETVPITIMLNLITIPIIYYISIMTGIFSARYQGKFIDVASGSTMLALYSIPVMWAGVLLIGYLCSNQYLHWFPTDGIHDISAPEMYFLPRYAPTGWERGWLLDTLWHLVLPVICLTYGGFAMLTKLARGSILENLRADFVRTARAKGVDERNILMRHVWRNSLLPMITIFAGILPGLFVGSVVVENIFSIQGMGKLGIEAALMKDRELIMGTTLMAGMLGLSVELCRDIAYAIADPRVSYE